MKSRINVPVLLAASLIAPAVAGAQADPAGEATATRLRTSRASAEARLDAAVRVQSADATSSQDDPVAETIRQLRATGHVNRIEALGEAAGPYLRAWAESVEDSMLLSTLNDNPLYHLNRTAPMGAVEYYSDLEKNDPRRFDLVMGTAQSFVRLLSRELIEDHQESAKLEARLLDLTNRTVMRESLTPVVRVDIARRAYREGLRSEVIVDVLRSNIGLATRLWGNELEPLARLAAMADRPLPENLPSELISWIIGSPPVFGSPERLAEIVEVAATRSPSEDPIPAKSWAYLGRQWRTNASFPPAAVERITRAVCKAKDPRVTEAWIAAGRSFASAEQALGMWRGAADATTENAEALRRDLAAWFANELPAGRARADITLELFTSAPEASARTQKELLSTHGGSRDSVFRGRVHVQRAVWALSPALVPDAIAWLAQPDCPLHGVRYANGSGWVEADAELRTVLNDASRTEGEWLLAAASLLTSGKSTAKDRAQIIAWLGQLAADAKDSAKMAKKIAGLVQDRNGDSPLHWGEVSAALMEDGRIPDQVACVLPLVTAGEADAERPVVVRFLDAAEERAKKATMPIRFTGSEYYGVRAAAYDKSLLRPTLMKAWIQEKTITNDLIEAVENSDEPDLVASLQARLVRLVEESSGPTKIRNASWLLKLPGNEPIEALIGLAMASEDAKFVEYVDDRISRRMRLQEAAARWSSATTGLSSRAEAVTKVLALLESPDLAIRVEAIHGLGVLGAVETLPTLIPLVADENAEVRTAARATLKRLRETTPEKAALTPAQERAAEQRR